MSYALTTVHRGYLHPFQNGRPYLYGIGEQPRTLVELAMCQLSAELRSKVKWWRFRQNPAVKARWAQEASERLWVVKAASGDVHTVLSEHQINYVLDELEGYAVLRDEKNGCEVSCFDRIWQADNLLSTTLLSCLNAEIQHLSPTGHRRNAFSQDLVDPFLHCVVYGRTRGYTASRYSILERCSVPSLSDAYTWSSRFSCIPTPFSVANTDGGIRVKALSYINNIDPAHSPLYAGIESVLSRCIPLFEHVLTDLHRDNPLRQRIPDRYRYTRWEEPEEPEYSDDEDGWLAYQRDLRQWTLHRPIRLPDVPEDGYTGGLATRHFVATLRDTTVKIILRMSEIRIPPGNAEYPGTPWHVEGMRDEHIAACLACCTHSENLVPPDLEFRMSVSFPREWLAGDSSGTLRTWGLDHLTPCCQHLGSVALAKNRAVAWPNVYQHRLGSARLLDSTREGTMTLLWLFLVDPDLDEPESGVSDPRGQQCSPPATDRVPPQQAAWMRRAVEDHIDMRLPVELVEQIVDLVEGVMSPNEAEAYAREMREERTRFWVAHDQLRFCLPFDVWGAHNDD